MNTPQTPLHYFITGTDTDAGKTYVTRLMAESLRDQGHEVALFKPIASGCDRPNDRLSNADIARFHEFDSSVPVELLNKWYFEPAIAPHIAAEEVGVNLSLNTLCQEMPKLYSERAQFKAYDIALTEGAGGWKLPLNSRETLDQWVIEQSMGIILVVGMKLGCINHALLTVENILHQQVRLCGWIANIPEDMPRLDENLETLKALIPVPCLGVVEKGQTKLSQPLRI